jgi:hypothetical protein
MGKVQKQRQKGPRTKKQRQKGPRTNVGARLSEFHKECAKLTDEDHLEKARQAMATDDVSAQASLYWVLTHSILRPSFKGDTEMDLQLKIYKTRYGLAISIRKSEATIANCLALVREVESLQEECGPSYLPSQ